MVLEILQIYSIISKTYTKRIYFTYNFVYSNISILSTVIISFTSYWSRVVKRGVFRATWKIQKFSKSAKFRQSRWKCPLRTFPVWYLSYIFLDTPPKWHTFRNTLSSFGPLWKSASPYGRGIEPHGYQVSDP